VDDLVAMVLSELDEPADLIAQSMGALVALRVALNVPEKVRRLVLTAASGGVAVQGLGGADWQKDYRREFPNAAAWITQQSETHEDLSSRLASIGAPSLLIFGDADAISPPSVGARLHQLLPHADFHVVHGGGHDLARTHAGEIAPLVADHLR
jgi:pimeloyl-ACP methyl ester carboxylesterase